MTLLAVDLLEPAWLLLLLPVVAVCAWLFRRPATRTRRDRLTLVLRGFVLSLLVLTLARPRGVERVERLAVAFVLDVSSSVPEGSRDALLAGLERQFNRIPEADRAMLVLFGERPSVEVPLTGVLDRSSDAGFGARLTNLESRLDRSESDLGRAVAYAKSLLPTDAAQRIVLLSDGNETRGDLLAAARGLSASGARLDVVPIEYAYTDEVLMEGVYAPGRAAADEPLEIRAVISSQASTSAEIILRAEGQELARGTHRLEPGPNVFRFAPDAPTSGYREFEVVVVPERDGNPANNVGRTSVLVEGLASALVVTGGDAEDRVTPVLRDAGVAAREAVPQRLPRHPAGYIGTSVVVLNGTPAYALDQDQREALRDAVKELGIGLVVIGGPEAYGVGGYRGTSLEELLPVDLDTRNKKTMPKGALAIVLHSIEFDSGNTWAVRICKAALDGLNPSDEAGIVYYDSMAAETWLFDLTPLTERETMNRLIDAVRVGDMQTFQNSFVLAEQSLAASDAAVKHVVVISDGDPQIPADALLNRLRAARVTVSGICIDPHGPGGPAPMRTMVARSGGRFYQLSSRKGLSSLPRLMMKEAAVLRRAALVEKPFTPLVAAPNSPLLRGTEGGFPQLHGYAVCGTKAGTEILLLANDEEEDPLLTAWYAGLGRVVAFTSDASSRWAKEWLGWDRFGPFWAQIVRSAVRTTEDRGHPVRITGDGSSLTLVMEATDADDTPVTGLSPTGSIVGRGGESRPVTLRQERPGVYTARVEGLGQGHFLARIGYTEDGRERQSLAVGAIDFAPEHRALESRAGILEEAARVTGGARRPLDAPFFAHDFAATQGVVEWWPRILAFAAMLLLVELFVRRFDIPVPNLGRLRLPRANTTAKSDVPPSTKGADRSVYEPTPTDSRGAPTQTNDGPPPAQKPDGGTLSQLKKARDRADKRREWK